jgi:hypothetical protein
MRSFAWGETIKGIALSEWPKSSLDGVKQAITFSAGSYVTGQ